MLPTFAAQRNCIVIENLTRTFPLLRPLQHGDVVALVQPQTLEPVTKRIIGLAGDEILLSPDEPDSRCVRVPKGHVWVEGDNRTASRDSRQYGPVPIALLRGRVLAQVSLARAGQPKSDTNSKLWPLIRFMYPPPSFEAIETKRDDRISVKLQG
jgi:inner membrane protease subunit 1